MAPGSPYPPGSPCRGGILLESPKGAATGVLPPCPSPCGRLSPERGRPRLGRPSSQSRLAQSGSKSRLALAGGSCIQGFGGRRSASRSVSPEVSKVSTNSEVERLVACHLAPLREVLKRRSPKDLEVVLQQVCGEKYIRLTSRLRRCKQEPTKLRAACEIAVASQLVQVRTLLKSWQQALRDIATARGQRDPGALQSLLERWAFADDEPEVRAARNDLAKWAKVYADYASKLNSGESSESLAALKELNRNGPRKMDGLAEVMQRVSRYRDQEKALQAAIASRCSRDLAIAVQKWDFEATHTVHARACTLLLEHREAVRDMASLAEAAQQALLQGSDVAAPYLHALHDAVVGWPFAPDADLSRLKVELIEVEARFAMVLRQEAAAYAAQEGARRLAAAHALYAREEAESIMSFPEVFASETEAIAAAAATEAAVAAAAAFARATEAEQVRDAISSAASTSSGGTGALVLDRLLFGRPPAYPLPAPREDAEDSADRASLGSGYRTVNSLIEGDCVGLLDFLENNDSAAFSFCVSDRANPSTADVDRRSALSACDYDRRSRGSESDATTGSIAEALVRRALLGESAEGDPAMEYAHALLLRDDIELSDTSPYEFPPESNPCSLVLGEGLEVAHEALELCLRSVM